MSEFKTARLRDTSGRLIGSTAQVRQAVLRQPIYMSTTRFTNIPNLSLTIRPYSNTSRILLMVSVSIAINGHGGIRLIREGGYAQEDRSGIEIGSGGLLGTNAGDLYYAVGEDRESIDATQDRNQALDWIYGTPSYNTVYSRPKKGGTWLDSPRTTSALTYAVQYANPHSSSYYSGINYVAYNNANESWGAHTVSTLTAIEIMGE